MIAFMNIALNHQTDNRTVAIFDLGDHGFRNRRLTTVIFIRITMTAIYHQCRAQSRLLHLFFTLRHIYRAVVWRFTAAQEARERRKNISRTAFRW